MMSRAGWVLVGSLVAGCTSAADSPGTSETRTGTSEGACNPLAAQATTLGTIVGVGKDAAGTLYVIDEPAVDVMRVFLGKDGALVEQPVSGAALGQTVDSETITGPDGAQEDLTAVLVNGKATSMSLGPSGSGKATSEGLDGGATTTLTLVDPSTVTGLPATALPPSTAYVADGSNGDSVVVTTTLEEGDYVFRIFYGPPSAMVEYVVTSEDQALSGYPTIDFTVGSSKYVMEITCSASYGGVGSCAPGPVILSGGPGGDVTFTLRSPTPTTLSGFTFTCLGT